MRDAGAAGLALACVLAASGARAEWIADASAGLDYDSNVSRAQYGNDIESDGRLSVDVAPGYYLQASDRIALILRADLGGAKYLEFGGLDYLTAGVGAAVRAKLGLGAQAPWVRAGLSVAHDDFEFGPRDAMQWQATFTAGMRFGERWGAQAGYLFERRRADKVRDIPFLADVLGIRGNAFDTDAHSLFVNGTFDINERLSALFGYTRRMGQVTATTHVDAEIFEASDAITPDPVFGIDRFAYRADADSNIFSAGLSYALGEHASLSLGYEYRETNANYGFHYENHLAHLSVLYSF